MTPTEARALRPGNLVRALIPVSGGVCLAEGGEIEVSLPAGAIATVSDVETFKGPQGWAVHLCFDNGIGNTFDEGDADAFALERVEDTPETRRERAAFLMAHSPPDYPAEELLSDLEGLLKAPKARPHGVRIFRVNLRGYGTAVLELEAYDEEEAVKLASRWTRNSLSVKAELKDDLGCDDWEVESLED